MTVTIDPEKHPECDGRTQTLTTDDVDAIFEEVREKDQPNQGDYLRRLYEAAFGFDVYGDDTVKKIDGWPTVSETLSDYITKKAIAFDREFHSCMPGGLWMSSGFSTSPDIEGNKVELPRLKVETRKIPEIG